LASACRFHGVHCLQNPDPATPTVDSVPDQPFWCTQASVPAKLPAIVCTHTPSWPVITGSGVPPRGSHTARDGGRTRSCAIGWPFDDHRVDGAAGGGVYAPRAGDERLLLGGGHGLGGGVGEVLDDVVAVAPVG